MYVCMYVCTTTTVPVLNTTFKYSVKMNTKY